MIDIKSHWQKQQVWYKPWTWFMDTILVIDEIKIYEASFLKGKKWITKSK